MSNTAENMKRALVLSKRDQIIEIFKDKENHIVRVHEEGAQTQEDIDLIKQCVGFVLGEISLAKAEQYRITDE